MTSVLVIVSVLVCITPIWRCLREGRGFKIFYAAFNFALEDNILEEATKRSTLDSLMRFPLTELFMIIEVLALMLNIFYP